VNDLPDDLMPGDDFPRALQRVKEVRADFPKYLQSMGVAETEGVVELCDDEGSAFRCWACGCRMRRLILLHDLSSSEPRPCGRHRRAVLGDA